MSDPRRVPGKRGSRHFFLLAAPVFCHGETAQEEVSPTNTNMLMKQRSLIIVIALSFFARGAFGTQADDTTITITGQNPGPTAFISQLTLSASDTSVLKSIGFAITPKPGSVTRPLSGTYTQDYMISRGYLVP